MSRSSLSCLFSRRNRTISAFSAFLTLFPVFPGKAFAPSLCSSSRQRYKRTTGILRSRATWVTGFPDSFDKRTASNLNSRLYFLLVRRCMLDTPVLCILHSSQVSIFSGEVQGYRIYFETRLPNTGLKWAQKPSFSLIFPGLSALHHFSNPLE